jgi:hypothetical protein
MDLSSLATAWAVPTTNPLSAARYDRSVAMLQGFFTNLQKLFQGHKCLFLYNHKDKAGLEI